MLNIFCKIWEAISRLRKRHILPANKNLSSGYFSLAKFQLAYLQPFSCHDFAKDVYLEMAKTVFSHLNKLTNMENIQEGDIREEQILQNCTEVCINTAQKYV